MPRTPLKVHGRWICQSLLQGIDKHHKKDDPDWVKNERPVFVHYSCSFFLAGGLAFLEGKYGEHPWTEPGAAHPTFDAYIDAYIQSAEGMEKKNFQGISENSCEALRCIRNAVTHNENDLSKNKDRGSLSKVTAAAPPGVTLNGPIVTLELPFMEFARTTLVAVSYYYGDD